MRPIICVHVPKCAGTSFRKYLEQVYGKDRMTEVYPHPWGPVGYPIPNVRDDSIIYGHFQAKRYKGFLGQARFIVWLRNPISRLVSQYRYWIHSPAMYNPACQKMHDKRLSLLDFARLPEMRNLQSWFLDETPIELFDFVGLTEFYNEHFKQFNRIFEIFNLSEIFGFDMYEAPAFGKINVDQSTQYEIAALNDLDMRLYQSVLNQYLDSMI